MEYYYYKDGTTSTEWDLNKTLHREDGPAMDKFFDGTKRWYVDGKPHRVAGPAVVFPNGDKVWFINGKSHRVDGPAVELASGTKHWRVNDKLHRVDGPAIECADGTKCWYVDGVEYDTEDDFNKFIKDVKALDQILQLTDPRQWVRELGKKNLE